MLFSGFVFKKYCCALLLHCALLFFTSIYLVLFWFQFCNFTKTTTRRDPELVLIQKRIRDESGCSGRPLKSVEFSVLQQGGKKMIETPGWTVGWMDGWMACQQKGWSSFFANFFKPTCLINNIRQKRYIFIMLWHYMMIPRNSDRIQPLIKIGPTSVPVSCGRLCPCGIFFWQVIQVTRLCNEKMKHCAMASTDISSVANLPPCKRHIMHHFYSKKSQNYYNYY